MGSYKNFNESMKLLTYHQFVHFLDLRHWVNKAIVLQFYSEAARDSLRVAFDEIHQPSRMFSGDDRFPVGYYAKLGDSDIGLAVTAALRALDLPSGEAPIKGYDYVTIDVTAAKEAFDTALNKIIEIIDCVDPKKLVESGIFSQSTFETTYALFWSDAKRTY